MFGKNLENLHACEVCFFFGRGIHFSHSVIKLIQYSIENWHLIPLLDIDTKLFFQNLLQTE